jgi:hypothetical protein
MPASPSRASCAPLPLPGKAETGVSSGAASQAAMTGAVRPGQLPRWRCGGEPKQPPARLVTVVAVNPPGPASPIGAQQAHITELRFPAVACTTTTTRSTAACTSLILTPASPSARPRGSVPVLGGGGEDVEPGSRTRSHLPWSANMAFGPAAARRGGQPDRGVQVIPATAPTPHDAAMARPPRSQASGPSIRCEVGQLQQVHPGACAAASLDRLRRLPSAQPPAATSAPPPRQNPHPGSGDADVHRSVTRTPAAATKQRHRLLPTRRPARSAGSRPLTIRRRPARGHAPRARHTSSPGPVPAAYHRAPG